VNQPPDIRTAGIREQGAVCLHCRQELALGDQVATCRQCGAVHHANCFETYGHCGSYECTPDSRPTGQREMVLTGAVPMRITDEELGRAVPLPPSRPATAATGAGIAIPVGPDPEASRWNRLAIFSLVIALLGIPLYGIVTGLVAILLGGISLIGRNSFRRRGVLVAVLGIVIGIGDFVGWAVYLGQDVSFLGNVVRLDDFEPDPEALKQLPATINRAMKANVLIQAGSFASIGIGSGVILKIDNGKALIVTNRHVIDPDFEDDDVTPLEELSSLMVKLIGQPATPAQPVWIAPDGVDLALVSVPVVSTDVLSAAWNATPDLKIGDGVFAIGNPHGLGWSHASGDVSQLRRQTNGTTRIRVIQTTTAINSGNSGGGLYDEQGKLVGVNTWTKDKRVAEGIGFAISFQTLMELVPARFALPAAHAPRDEME